MSSMINFRSKMLEDQFILTKLLWECSFLTTMNKFKWCLSSRVNISKHFDFESSKRCMLWGPNCFTPKHLIEYFKQAGFHPITWLCFKQAGMNVSFYYQIYLRHPITWYKFEASWNETAGLIHRYLQFFVDFISNG